MGEWQLDNWMERHHLHLEANNDSYASWKEDGRSCVFLFVCSLYLTARGTLSTGYIWRLSPINHKRKRGCQNQFPIYSISQRQFTIMTHPEMNGESSGRPLRLDDFHQHTSECQPREYTSRSNHTSSSEHSPWTVSAGWEAISTFLCKQHIQVFFF